MANRAAATRVSVPRGRPCRSSSVLRKLSSACGGIPCIRSVRERSDAGFSDTCPTIRPGSSSYSPHHAPNMQAAAREEPASEADSADPPGHVASRSTQRGAFSRRPQTERAVSVRVCASSGPLPRKSRSTSSKSHRLEGLAGVAAQADVVLGPCWHGAMTRDELLPDCEVTLSSKQNGQALPVVLLDRYGQIPYLIVPEVAPTSTRIAWNRTLPNGHPGRE